MREVERLPIPAEETLVVFTSRLMPPDDCRKMPEDVVIGQVPNTLKEVLTSIVIQL